MQCNAAWATDLNENRRSVVDSSHKQVRFAGRCYVDQSIVASNVGTASMQAWCAKSAGERFRADIARGEARPLTATFQYEDTSER